MTCQAWLVRRCYSRESWADFHHVRYSTLGRRWNHAQPLHDVSSESNALILRRKWSEIFQKDDLHVYSITTRISSLLRRVYA